MKGIKWTEKFPDEATDEEMSLVVDELRADGIEDMWLAAKLWYDFSERLNQQRMAKFRDAKTDRLIVQCPVCNGSGEDGYDRCIPPNSYVCPICDGSGKVEIIPAKAAEKGTSTVVCLACVREEIIPGHEPLPHGWETVAIPNTDFEYPVCCRECREWVLMLQANGELKVTLPEELRRSKE
jgi:hypothetical protein